MQRAMLAPFGEDVGGAYDQDEGVGDTQSDGGTDAAEPRDEQHVAGKNAGQLQNGEQAQNFGFFQIINNDSCGQSAGDERHKRCCQSLER